MTISSGRVFAVIAERNGQELVRDFYYVESNEDPRRLFMQLLKTHGIDSFEDPVNCRVEELSE